MYIFENLEIPWIGVPIVNYDNHQHIPTKTSASATSGEGIEIYAALLGDLTW